ncbi:MAG: CHAT domain-containing tetratricopeptide repeat protein [Blastomonas sp.]
MARKTSTRFATWLAALSASISVTAIAPAAMAQPEQPIALRDSFRIGSTGVLCTAQYRPTDPALSSMFDRGYRIVCRDATSPVGSLYALRGGEGDRLASYLDGARARLDCDDRQITEIDQIGGASVTQCRDAELGVDVRIYSLVRGNTVYLVEGLAGYDSALRLALASVVTNWPVSGTVEVATTSVSNPAAFARVQAGSLDADAARAEAYIRNNYGAYAESSEFFETLANREASDSLRTAEFVANQALQQSNLGDFVAATALLGRAEQLVAASDGVTQRMIRNFRAINELNQRDPAGTIAALGMTVSPVTDGLDSGDLAGGLVTRAMADRINRENAGLKRLGGVDGRLTAQERAQILDGQALLLQGTALRLQGRNQEALAALEEGSSMISGVRNGRVNSTAWLRSDVSTQRALIAESRGDYGEALSGFTEALQIFERDYPQSPALLGAKARLAAYLARRGSDDEAIALYDELVTDAETVPGAKAAMKDLLAPYFALLVTRADSDGDVATKLFDASQLLQRPGVAQTQAVLARELSEGDDEASALFRLAVTRTREISRTTAEVAALSELPNPTSEEQRQLADARDALALLEREQTVLQSRLGEYPRYRVLSPTNVTLTDLQKLLKPDEGYYKVSFVGEDVYAQLISPGKVRSVKVGMTRSQLDKIVAEIRDSIVVIENGQTVNYPFDVEKARALYLALFGELEEELPGIRHLVYEPDGALLQLPPGLLITKQQGVDDYLLRIEDITADAFDFRGIDWFARNRRFSIAVSPRSFADVRTIAPARGSQAYLGIGQNAPPPPQMLQASGSAGPDCSWPLSTWGRPISPKELFLAKSVFGDANSQVITGPDFTDQNLLARKDLDEYRILHFATHGLVTAPRPECPARPALVTSFGTGTSDGLLSFKEIFDMKLDADLVILSACDTAGQATASASREAGIETGGNFALDGLVRAFVGAGARSVLASHWPVPDDFNATEKLISALFDAKAGQSMNGSLALAQEQQMDDPLTSHPYYWAAFIILGDGDKPLIK